MTSPTDDDVNCVLIEDTYVWSGSADKTVRKWDMATCQCVAVLEGHEAAVNRLICTGDFIPVCRGAGDFIVSSSYDRTARCWHFDSGDWVRDYRAHKRSAFIPTD